MVKYIHEERIEADTKTEALKKARKKKYVTVSLGGGMRTFRNITVAKVVPSKNRKGVFFAKFRKRG